MKGAGAMIGWQDRLIAEILEYLEFWTIVGPLPKKKGANAKRSTRVL
jgi:hypothetical protein